MRIRMSMLKVWTHPLYHVSFSCLEKKKIKWTVSCAGLRLRARSGQQNVWLRSQIITTYWYLPLSVKWLECGEGVSLCGYALVRRGREETEYEQLVSRIHYIKTHQTNRCLIQVKKNQQGAGVRRLCFAPPPALRRLRAHTEASAPALGSFTARTASSTKQPKATPLSHSIARYR